MTKTSIGNREIFSKNLAYYVEKSGKSQKEISEIVGVSTSTFNDWMKAKKYPRIDKIEVLAAFFRCLKSDLIEERTEEHRKMNEKNDALVDIIFRMRTDVEFFEVVSQLNNLDPEKLSGIKILLK